MEEVDKLLQKYLRGEPMTFMEIRKLLDVSLKALNEIAIMAYDWKQKNGR